MKPVACLDAYETPLGDKVVERVRVRDDGALELDVVLIGPEARLTLAPDWRQEQGRRWP